MPIQFAGLCQTIFTGVFIVAMLIFSVVFVDLVDSLLLCACSTIYSTPHLLPWHSKPIGSDLLYVGLAISSCNRWWSLNPVGLQPPSRLGYRYHPLRLLRVLGGVRGPC